MLRTHTDPEYVLGQIPLANKLNPPHEKYELGFRWLKEGNLRLTEAGIVPADEMFSDYTYLSSTLSPAHINERMDLARAAYDYFVTEEHAPSSVLEVACNDGYMLNRYADDERFDRVAGVDPAKNLHRYINDRVYAYPKMMTSAIGDALRQLHGSFDIVHAHNVVAHTPNPVDLLKGISNVMSTLSVAVIEFQYLVDLIRKTQFYHFYHEHYFYFSLHGFMDYASRAGLKVVAAKRVDAQGGSLICALMRQGDPMESKRYQITDAQGGSSIRTFEVGQGELADAIPFDDPLLESERRCFAEGAVFANLMKETERHLRNFVNYVNAQAPRSLYGVFASAKSTVILNLAAARGLKLDRFICFYDSAPTKWNKCVPGTEIEIRALHPIEKACGRGILFASALIDVARGLLPDVELLSIDDVFKGLVGSSYINH